MRAATEAIETVADHSPVTSLVKQWRTVFMGVMVLGVLAVLLVCVWSPKLPSLQGSIPVGGTTLPGALGPAATCRHTGAGGDGDQCVIAGGDALLSGGISGGRDLTFVDQVVSAGRASDELRRWRSDGSTVVADGAVFVAISPSWAIRYADIGSGVRIETGSFVSSSAARTFLLRSGLLR
ncbi:hypothetical protein ACFXO9_31015 [Nocardia tengchongensis]|uniref:hypothetical protein n=1 Tax=Nocardia tengchongensis TaxID=2055889 RepID=UPI00367C0B77